MDYSQVNRKAWDAKTEVHWRSEFYNIKRFLSGKQTLNPIELSLLGEVKGKKVLHLQCHFGLDTLSISRLGAAKVVGVDFSEVAIEKARELAEACGLSTKFVCCDVYDTLKHVEDQYDRVFATYGTIGWLPDLQPWAKVIANALLPGGKLVFVEFHPVVWMMDDDFQQISYRYAKGDPIIETNQGTYADPMANLHTQTITWNHGLAEVVTSLLNEGLHITHFQEYDYSPYSCFKHLVEFEPGKFRVKHLSDKIPMVYSLVAGK